MCVVKEWPVLIATARTGKTKYWQVRVLQIREQSQIEVEWWQENSVHQQQARNVVGKNLGRLNETTSSKQALLEAEADFKKQLDKGYSLNGTTKKAYALPMLAQDFKAKRHKLVFPCFAQPKLDGVRSLYSPGLGFWSRQGKPFTAVDLSHLRWDIDPHITLDGELILPHPYTFQQSVSAIKKQNELTPLLEYHVFDMVIAGPYRNRWMTLDSLSQQRVDRPEKLFIVDTNTLHDAKEVESSLHHYLSIGYEGLILRNYEGEYEVGQRSSDLQKYKEFVDEEFCICGVTDGQGKEEGAAIFVCHAKLPGKFFSVRPVGTYESRREMFEHSERYIGQWLTVRFQNKTDDGLPRFPVGKAFRSMVDGRPEL